MTSIRRKRSNRSRKRKSIRRKSVRRKSVRRRSMKGGVAGATIAAAGAAALTIGKTGKKIYDLKQENKRLQKKEEGHAKAIQDTRVLFREERNKLLQLQAKHEEENKNRKEQHDKLVHSAHEIDIILNKPKAKEIFRLATGGENGVIHFDDFKDCLRFSDTDEIHSDEIDFLKEIFDESEGGNIYETEMSIEEFVNFILREDFEIDLDDMIECLKQKHK